MLRITCLRTVSFLCFPLMQYLASSSSPSSAHEQLEVAPTIDVVSTSALAGDCGDDASTVVHAPPSACFDSATQSFKREWLLWKGRPMRDASLTAAINTDELSVALHRFDDVEPLSMATGNGNNNHAALKEEKAAALEATKEAQQEKAENKESGGAAKTGSDALETTDGMPEGGRKRSRTRRLAEASTRNNDDDDNHNIGDDANNDASTPAFTITVGNAYTAKSGGYSTEYPWRYMAEPFRATTLAVEAPLSGASYRWTVDGHVQGYGSSISVLFQQIGYHTVTVERLTGDDDDSTETTPVTVTANVMCKYVRREVRSLTDADREAWLSAVQVLQHVPTTAGQVRNWSYRIRGLFDPCRRENRVCSLDGVSLFEFLNYDLR